MRRLLMAFALLSAAAALRADEMSQFERKAEMNPNDASAQFNWAVKASEAKNYKAAIKAINRVVELSPKDAQALELKGQLLAQSGDDKGALAAWEKCVALDPKRSRAWANLAKLYAAKEDKESLKKAAAAFEAAAKGDPKNFKLLMNQGVISSKLGDDKKALALFEKASKMEGGAAASAKYLCQLYNVSGDNKKAEVACLAASADPKASAETFYYLGFAQSRLGKKEASLASFQKSVELNGSYAPALYSLGYSDYEAGRLPDALKHFQGAVDAKGGDYPEAQFNVAVVLGDLGRWTEAADIYRKILKKDSENQDAKANLDFVIETGTEALLNRGKDSYEAGEFETASKAWKQALELDPENSTAKEFLAKIKSKSAKQDSASAARKAVRKAVVSKLKSEDEKVLQGGLAAFKAGKLGQAVKLLDFYARKHPDSKAALQSLYKAKSQLSQQVDDLLQQAGRSLAGADKPGAKALIAKALALDPGSARANKMLAQVTGSEGTEKASAEQLKKQYFTGVDAYLDGDLPKAIGIWKKILEADPGHLDARRSLSQAEVELVALQKKK